MTERYSRQTLFRPIGEAGQRQIREGLVTVVGCGALGTVAAEMLTRAGVGRLRIIDRDFVELSNLQRQTLFTERHAEARVPKAIAASETLREINSDVETQCLAEDLNATNAVRLLDRSDVIVDATDNFETRYLINDVAVKHDISWVYGGCVGSYGIATAFLAEAPGCFRCLVPDTPERGTQESCDTVGILAPAVHVVASYQVTQVFKILVGEKLAPELFTIDVWESSWRTLSIKDRSNPDCPCCVHSEFEYLEGSQRDRLTQLCGRDAVQIVPAEAADIDFGLLQSRLSRSGHVRFNEHLMHISVDGFEIALFRDGRSIIKGTDNLSEAKSVYARYIGS